jgi:flagellar basal body-associated protein FliL
MAKTETTEPTTAKSGGGWMPIIKMGAFLGVVVVVEVVAAAFMLPSAQDIEKTARALTAAQLGGDLSEVDADTPLDSRDVGEPTVEVRLGLFNVTRYNPEKDTTMIVDFEVFGVVMFSEQHAFEEQFAKHEIRIREQVIMTLQAAEATDLRGEGLGLIKRRLLEKTNRALGRPLVREVVFSKFNFVER